MDEIKVKERTVLSLERDLGVQAAHARKLQQQNQAVNDQLAVIRDLSPKKEVPYSPGAGDNTADNTANPVSKFHSPPNNVLLVNVAPTCCSENNIAASQEVALVLKLLQSIMTSLIRTTKVIMI